MKRLLLVISVMCSTLFFFSFRPSPAVAAPPYADYVAVDLSPLPLAWHNHVPAQAGIVLDYSDWVNGIVTTNGTPTEPDTHFELAVHFWACGPNVTDPSGWELIADIEFHTTSDGIDIFHSIPNLYGPTYDPRIDRPGGCGDTCDQTTLYNQASDACSGSQNIATIDYELCEFTCLPCSDVGADCESFCDPYNIKDGWSCTEGYDSSGNIISLTVDTCECQTSNCEQEEAYCADDCGGYYDFDCVTDNDGYVVSTDCQCDDCALERSQYAEQACGGLDFLLWYDCDTDTGECADHGCNDLLAQCISNCGGALLAFSCHEENGEPVVDVPCACEEDVNQDNTDPTGENDPDSTVDTEQDPDPADDDHALLEKIVNNAKATSENVKATQETLNRELNELNTKANKTNNLLQENNNLLSDLKEDLSDGLELEGSATLPGDNSYETDFEQPGENSLSDTVSSYIVSGLPLTQFIDGSGFTVANADPKLSCDVWGYTVDFDISPMESTLNWMGLVVFAVSTISAFMIVIKR